MKKEYSKVTRHVIDLLAKNELAFAKLYSKYAAIFSDRAFWLSLAEEENHHAEWIKALAQSRDVSGIDLKVLPLGIIEMSIRNVEKEIKSSEPISQKDALKISHAFETTFFEHNFFELFRGIGDSFQKVMDQLEAETKNHIKIIEDKLSEAE